MNNVPIHSQEAMAADMIQLQVQIDLDSSVSAKQRC
jgi:hypothetical protein